MRDLTAVKDALKKNHQIELPIIAGVREQRDPVQGIRPAWRAAHPLREDRRRRRGEHVDRDCPDSSHPHSLGQARDYIAMAANAEDKGVRIGAVNSNVFQDDDYQLGSVCNPARESVQGARASARMRDIMVARHARLKLWFADGTNYPGQDDLRAARRLAEGCRRLRHSGRISGCCWSTSCSSRRSTPPTCRTGAPACCTARRSAPGPGRGHRPPRAGREHRVHRGPAAEAGRLGGFDFNSRYYADDDLMVGSADPFQLFRITHEVVKAGALAPAAGWRSCSTSATTSSRRSRRRSARS